MKRLSLAVLFVFSSLPLSPLFGDDAKLDAILAEVRALREQVSELEGRIAELEETLQGVPAAVASEAPQSKSEKRNWIDNMRVELKKAEARASGPWTEPASWTKISKGMDEEAVIAILGEPTSRKFSVRLDTDEILIYEGDLSGNGDLISGEIRLYKGKVRRFEAPDLPSE